MISAPALPLTAAKRATPRLVAPTPAAQVQAPTRLAWQRRDASQHGQRAVQLSQIARQIKLQARAEQTPGTGEVVEAQLAAGNCRDALDKGLVERRNSVSSHALTGSRGTLRAGWK